MKGWLKNGAAAALAAICLPAAAQEAGGPSAPGDSLSPLPELSDDPIAAMLDSLLLRKYFECSAFTTDTGALNLCDFPSDIVPRYDDAVYAERLARLSSQTPMELVYNDAVKKFIELYVVRKRNLSSRIMGLSELYFPMFEEVLDAYRLPLELKYLAIVESALNPNAVSRAGATGLWQFMYRTGKLYNLDVTSYTDGRRDPYFATVAACEYFRDLYGMFGDWMLVLAAYNSGPGTVSRAIRRAGGETDYWKLRTYLPAETRGYVPAFIAALYFMNHAADHNLYPIRPKKLYFEIDTVKVNRPVSFVQISAVLDIPVEDLEYLNPVYRSGYLPADGMPMTLTLPAGKTGLFVSNEQSVYAWRDSRKEAEDSAAQAVVMTEVKSYHTVRSGEHLGGISARYNCTIDQIRAWNNLKGTLIHPNQKLVIYKKTMMPAPQEKTAAQENSAGETAGKEEDGFIWYVVQPGDTLHDIADKHEGVSVSGLKELNGIPDGSEDLTPGTKLKVSVK